MKLRKILTVSAATLMALSVGANINNVNAKRRSVKRTTRQVHNNKSSKYYKANMKTIRDNNKIINRLKRHHQHNKNWKKMIQLYEKENYEIRRRIHSKRNIKSMIDDINANLDDMNGYVKGHHKHSIKRNSSTNNLYSQGYKLGRKDAKVLTHPSPEEASTPYDGSELLRNKKVLNKSYDHGLMSGFASNAHATRGGGNAHNLYLPKQVNYMGYYEMIRDAKTYWTTKNKTLKEIVDPNSQLNNESNPVVSDRWYLKHDKAQHISNAMGTIGAGDDGGTPSRLIKDEYKDGLHFVKVGNKIKRQFNKNKRYYMFG